MKYRFLLHDLHEEDASKILGELPRDVIVFPAKPRVRHCVGCFGCWVKTPGKCVIADRCVGTPAMLAASNKMILISRNVYGGFSPEVKAVLDRSIGYAMPFFRFVGGEMHHTMRYPDSLTITAHFYGDAISETERGIARRLVKANLVNLGGASCQIRFHDSPDHLKEAVQCELY